MTSPRAWAFGLLGIQEYLRRFSGDRLAGQVRDALTARLIDLYDRTATPDWPWFEEILSLRQRPAAARPDRQRPRRRRRAGPGGRPARPGLAGRGPDGPAGALPGDRLPRLLPQGAASRPGSTSSRSRPTRRSPPAWRRTGPPRTPRWLNEARSAFEWFLGRNDLGQELYDPATGGCCDGLQEDRVNRNQGAESTLAFLLSLAEMNLLESSLAAFRQAR